MNYYGLVSAYDADTYQITQIYSENDLVELFNLNEKQYNSFDDIPSDMLFSIGIYIVDDNINEDGYDDFKFILYEKHFSYWDFDSTSLIILKQYDTEPLTFDERKNLLIQDLSKKRFEIETMGININGNIIATDRESQSILNSTFMIMKEHPDKIINWKCLNGWTQIDSTTITVIIECVIDYVEKCFSNEKGLWDIINNVANNDWESLRNVDINIGWPSNIYNI